MNFWHVGWAGDILGNISQRQLIRMLHPQVDIPAMANTLNTAPTNLSCETGLGTGFLTALNTNEDMSDNRK